MLEHYDIRGVASEWIKSYLCNKKQFVKVDNVYSDYKEVICSIAQASILGPKLFITYLNDICNVSTLFTLFANDINVFCSGHNIYKLCEKISIKLKKYINGYVLINYK